MVGKTTGHDFGRANTPLQFLCIHQECVSGDDGTCSSRPLETDTKKKTYRASQRDREDLKRQREEFTELVRAIMTGRFVFIDEAGCQLGMDRRYARSAPGERAHCKRPFYRGDQINLIGAVATNGLRCLWEVTGTVNGAMFTAFIEKGLAPKLNPKDLVIMDNLPGHKVAGVRRAIEKRGAKVVLLPPYSPDLNPIELLWSKLKEIIRSYAPKTTRAFSRALRTAMNAITTNDIRNWFRHCGYHST
jgi:transposase